VHGPFGWVLTVGLMSLGIGSMSLVFGLVPSSKEGGARPAGGWSECGGWGLAGRRVSRRSTRTLERASIPRGHDSRECGHAGVPGATARRTLLARTFRQDPRWRPHGSLFRALAVAAAISLVLFMASLAPVFVRPGPPVLLGLSERVLLATYAAWLVAVGIESSGTTTRRTSIVRWPKVDLNAPVCYTQPHARMSLRAEPVANPVAQPARARWRRARSLIVASLAGAAVATDRRTVRFCQFPRRRSAARSPTPPRPSSCRLGSRCAAVTREPRARR
jgi:hypothetical protein